MERERMLAYIRSIRLGNEVFISAPANFCGKWEGTVIGISFRGNYNDKIMVRNGIVREIFIYDILSIEIKGQG